MIIVELVAPVLPEMDAAYAAFVAYGKGSGHPAGQNFGDVFSYALAKVRGLPLLYKGDDFAQTTSGARRQWPLDVKTKSISMTQPVFLGRENPLPG